MRSGWECAECDKFFGDVNELDRHIDSVHVDGVNVVRSGAVVGGANNANRNNNNAPLFRSPPRYTTIGTVAAASRRQVAAAVANVVNMQQPMMTSQSPMMTSQSPMMTSQAETLTRNDMDELVPPIVRRPRMRHNAATTPPRPTSEAGNASADGGSVKSEPGDAPDDALCID